MDRDLYFKDLEEELAESKSKIDSLEKKVSGLQQENSNLKGKNHSFKELILSSPSLITLLSGKDLIIKLANDPILQFWGKGEDIIGKPLVEAHPEVREQGFEKLLLDVMESGNPEYDYEVPVYITRNDHRELCYFNFIYQPQRDLHGEVNNVAVIAQEVIPEAKVHQNLKDSETKYREMADFMPHKISIADAKGHSYFYNKSWQDYTGLSMQELIDTHRSVIIHPDHKEIMEEELEECLSTGKNMDLELKILNKDNEYKWHLCRATAVKDEDDNITAWISSSTEIQKLKEEEQRKEDFLKLVSHELKTPVTSIKGYVQLLLTLLKDRNDKGVPVELSKPYLHRIKTGGKAHSPDLGNVGSFQN